MELHYNLQIAGSISINASPSETHLTVVDDASPTPREVMLNPNHQVIINQTIIDALFGHHNPPANTQTPVYPTGGTLTYKVFLDLNSNAIQDLGENDGGIPSGTSLTITPVDGLAPIVVDLAGLGRVDHMTLPVGIYNTHINIPAGYHSLNVLDQTIQIDGSSVDINLGAVGIIAD